MRLSVTARIALLATLLPLISNLVLVAFLWRSIHDDAIDALRRDTIEQSDALASVYRTDGLGALTRAINQARAPGDVSLIMVVIDAQGRRVDGIGPPAVQIGTPETVTFHIGRIAASRPWSERDAGYSVRQIGSYRLVSGRLLDDWQQEQRGIEDALAAASLLSLGLGAIAGLIVTRYVVGRLRRVTQVMEDVAAGDLDRRVPTAPGGDDAFDGLARQLNAMLDRLSRLLAELRLMTDSLMHDLRSPLARLRTRAETAALADGEAREAALGGLIVETDLVMRTLSMLIETSRAESVSRDRFAAIDPAALVSEIGELYEPVVEDAGMALEVGVPSRPSLVTLHRELMSQAITNLIDNTLNHAADGGAIALTLTLERGEARFAVADHGPGIAEESREQALRRFGRLDTARSTPGAGLGLALVEAVARLHGGRLELGDNAPGLVATIVVPV